MIGVFLGRLQAYLGGSGHGPRNTGRLAHPGWATASRPASQAPADPTKATARRR